MPSRWVQVVGIVSLSLLLTGMRFLTSDWQGGSGNGLTSASHPDDCPANVIGTQGSFCTDIDDGRLWSCQNPSNGGASSTLCDDPGDWVLNSVSTGGAVDTFESRTGTVVSAPGDYTTAEVTNTPAGTIAATDAQAAINELDTEKLATGANAATASALAADPANCNSNSLARGIDAAGVATPCIDVLTDDATVNEAGDPISWSKIKDIPAGLADGTDDSGSATAFSALTSGTNTGVAGIIGTGASLAHSGTGTISASTRGGKEKAISKYASLNAAITAAAAGDTILIDAATTMSASLSVPENVLLQWVGCDLVTVPNAMTLTVLSPVSKWPTCQIFAFTGTGALSFNQNRYLQDLQLEWVGGIADDSTDNAPAFNRIVTACATGGIQGCPIRVFNGIYKFTTNIAPVTTPAVSLKGVGGLLFNGTAQATTFKCAAASGICFDFQTSIHNSNATIEDINFTDGNATPTLMLMRIFKTNRYSLSHVSFTDAAIGLQVNNDGTGPGAPCDGATVGGDSSWHLFTQLVFYNNTVGLDAFSGAGSVVVAGDFFSEAGQVGMRVHECMQGWRVLGAKFDGGAPALWVEGGAGQYVGINCEGANPCLKVGDAATTYVRTTAAWRNNFIGVSFQGLGGATVGFLNDTNAKRTMLQGTFSTWGTNISDVSISADSTMITDAEGIRTNLPVKGQIWNSGVRTVSGASYTFLATDVNKMMMFTSATAFAPVLPAATTAGFTAGAPFLIYNRGIGTKTITPTTSTINGAATLALTTGMGAYIVSDGTNYSAWVTSNALTQNPLSQFAATTSAQLSGVISDETGSGAAVFAGSPTFTGTPILPTPFTLGAVSVLPTGTELNFVDGVTSSIQTQIDTHAALTNPHGATTAPTANTIELRDALGGTRQKFTRDTLLTLPTCDATSAHTETVFIEGEDSQDCGGTGGGTAENTCYCDGLNWIVKAGSTSAQSFTDIYNNSGAAPEIPAGANGLLFSGYNSQTKSLKLCGDGPDPQCSYWYIDGAGRFQQVFEHPTDLTTALYPDKIGGFLRATGDPILTFTEAGAGSIATSLAPTGSGTNTANRTTCTGTNILKADGTCMSDVVRVLDKNTANVDIATTTETTLYSYTVPANTLGTDKCLRVTAIGQGLNNTGVNRTFTIRLKYGGTSTSAAGALQSTSTGQRASRWIGYVCGDGATNAQRFVWDWIFTGSTSATGNSATIDSTASQTLLVTMDLEITDAAHTWNHFYAITELLP